MNSKNIEPLFRYHILMPSDKSQFKNWLESNFYLGFIFGQPNPTWEEFYFEIYKPVNQTQFQKSIKDAGMKIIAIVNGPLEELEMLRNLAKYERNVFPEVMRTDVTGIRDFVRFVSQLLLKDSIPKRTGSLEVNFAFLLIDALRELELSMPLFVAQYTFWQNYVKMLRTNVVKYKTNKQKIVDRVINTPSLIYIVYFCYFYFNKQNHKKSFSDEIVRQIGNFV